MSRTRTLDEYRLEGFTHLTIACDVCARMVALPIATMPVKVRGLDMAALVKRLTCKKCGTPTKDVEPWREDMQRRMW